eukprot:4484294-Alexandrium_andersonii.AAC.1
MTASASSGSTGRSWPGWRAGPTTTASISGADGADCELTGALDPWPRAGAAEQDAGGRDSLAARAAPVT